MQFITEKSGNKSLQESLSFAFFSSHSKEKIMNCIYKRNHHPSKLFTKTFSKSPIDMKANFLINEYTTLKNPEDVIIKLLTKSLNDLKYIQLQGFTQVIPTCDLSQISINQLAKLHLTKFHSKKSEYFDSVLLSKKEKIMPSLNLIEDRLTLFQDNIGLDKLSKLCCIENLKLPTQKCLEMKDSKILAYIDDNKTSSQFEKIIPLTFKSTTSVLNHSKMRMKKIEKTERTDLNMIYPLTTTKLYFNDYQIPKQAATTTLQNLNLPLGAPQNQNQNLKFCSQINSTSSSFIKLKDIRIHKKIVIPKDDPKIGEKRRFSEMINYSSNDTNTNHNSIILINTEQLKTKLSSGDIGKITTSLQENQITCIPVHSKEKFDFYLDISIAALLVNGKECDDEYDMSAYQEVYAIVNSSYFKYKVIVLVVYFDEKSNGTRNERIMRNLEKYINNKFQNVQSVLPIRFIVRAVLSMSHIVNVFNDENIREDIAEQSIKDFSKSCELEKTRAVNKILSQLMIKLPEFNTYETFFLIVLKYAKDKGTFEEYIMMIQKKYQTFGIQLNTSKVNDLFSSIYNS